MDVRAVCFSITVLDDGRRRRRRSRRRRRRRRRPCTTTTTTTTTTRWKQQPRGGGRSWYDEPDCVHEVHVTRTNDFPIHVRQREKNRGGLGREARGEEEEERVRPSDVLFSTRILKNPNADLPCSRPRDTRSFRSDSNVRFIRGNLPPLRPFLPSFFVDG